MNKTTSTPRAGFTLIELLLVISIIAVLAGMIFPVGSRIMDRARTTSCANNMRQLGVAALASASDNDGRFPAIELDSNDPVYEEGVDAKPLNEAFKRYGITDANLQCPADLKGPNWFAKTGASYLWQPYSEDELEGTPSIYARGRQIPVRPSRLRLATDYEPVHASDTLGSRKRSNTLYADGHVTLR